MADESSGNKAIETPAGYQTRRHLIEQTSLSIHLPPNRHAGRHRDDEIFSRFAATWMANTSTGAAFALNHYLIGDLKIAAHQSQNKTPFEDFFETYPNQARNSLAILQSRANLIRKVRQLHGIHGAQFHLEELQPLQQNIAQKVESMVNHAKAEVDQHPIMHTLFHDTIIKVNDKMLKQESAEIMRHVDSENKRNRYANGAVVYDQIRRIQSSEQAQTIREDSQYIELVQTRDNFQAWALAKTGARHGQRHDYNPVLEDPNWRLKTSIAEYLHKKLYESAEKLKTFRNKQRSGGSTIGEGPIQLKSFYDIPDREFLSAINWETQGKQVHPSQQQLQMLREALSTAANALNNSDEIELDEFLKTGDKNNYKPTPKNPIQANPFSSRSMKILWICGAEAPVKIGLYHTASRKLQTDLQLAYKGNVLERLIKLIKDNFRWFAQFQQLVQINRQLTNIHRDLSHNTVARDQAAANLRSMPRI